MQSRPTTAEAAQQTLTRNQQKQAFLEQMADTEYGKQRMRLLHGISILDKTHITGKFSNADRAMHGITEWLKINPYAEAGDILDIVRKWHSFAKKDESVFSSDSKIFPNALEELLWTSIIAFIRILDAKEMNPPIAGSEEDIRGLKDQLEAMRSEIEVLRQANNTYKTSAALQEQAMDSQKKESQVAIKHLSDENSLLKAQLAEAQASIKELTVLGTQQSIELTRAQTQNEALSAQNHDLQVRIAGFEETVRQKDLDITKLADTTVRRFDDLLNETREMNRTFRGQNTSFITEQPSFQVPRHPVVTKSKSDTVTKPTVSACLKYITSKNCISAARLNAIAALGEFLGDIPTTVENASEIDFLTTSIKTLTTTSPLNASLHECLDGMIVAAKQQTCPGPLKTAHNAIIEKLEASSLQAKKESGAENLGHPDLFKGLANLFGKDAYNVAGLHKDFASLCKNRSRSNSTHTDESAVTADLSSTQGTFFKGQ